MTAGRLGEEQRAISALALFLSFYLLKRLFELGLKPTGTPAGGVNAASFDTRPMFEPGKFRYNTCIVV